MRLRKIKNADEIINDSKYVITNLENISSSFDNNNPINVEIGMGKGDFIINTALANPNINFIGVEKYASVLVSAIKKLENLEIPNLKIINNDILEISSFLENKVNALYLNFSDPWPKARHEKRRLTSVEFLNLYNKMFKDEVHIFQKTDNERLFSYSLMNYNNHGYQINDLSLNYHATHENIITSEYEEKFSGLGQMIYYVEVTKRLN